MDGIDGVCKKDEICEHFSDLNIVLENDVLDKCVEMCKTYNVDPEDFCDQWFAFTTTELQGDVPTLENLQRFEKKEFMKIKRSFSTPKQDSQYGKTAKFHITTPKRIPNNVTQATHQQIEEPISPVSPQSVRYSQRTDSNKIVCAFGDETDFKKTCDKNISVKNALETMPDNVMYMYETMRGKMTVLNDITDFLGHNIANAKFLTCENLTNRLGAVTTYGRIVSDSDGRINAESVLLEGSQESNLCNTTCLKLNNTAQYSLFPGQVVVVKGNKVKSNMFVAEEIHSDVSLTFPKEIPVTEAPLIMMVASGPFTLQDSISYEPLDDFIEQINKLQPHILILLGPFLGENHESVINGKLTQTFDSFFEDLFEKIFNSIRSYNTKVVVVSSARDVHHHQVYPTPPYKIKESYENWLFLPDPCVIDVDGLNIGITTADVMFHISNFELFTNKKSFTYSDRMSRIASHVLNQQCFYPLYPPMKEMTIDHNLLQQYGIMECKPHVMILPSSLRYFVKDVNGCLVVNPERLTKGLSAGTYAKIEIRPGETKSICNRTSCQIVRI